MYNNNAHWLRRHKILSVLLIISIVLALVVSLKSAIITYYLRDFFKQHASDVAIQELTIGLIDSDFTIKGLQTKHANGQQLNIDYLYVDWQFDGLLDNHVTINALTLDGITIDIQSDGFVPVQIGPLLLSKLQTADSHTEQSNETSEPWSIELNNISLSNLQLCLDDLTILYDELGLPMTNKQQRLGVCLTNESLNITGAVTVATDQGISADVEASFGNLAVRTTQGDSLLNLTSLDLEDISLSSEQVIIPKITAGALKLLADSEQATYVTLGLGFEGLEIDDLLAKLDASGVSFNDLTVTDLIMRTQASDNAIRPLIRMDNLNIDDFNLAQDETKFSNLSLENIQLLQNFTNSNSTEDYLLALAKLTVSKFIFKAEDIAVSAINFVELQGLLSINEQGNNFNNWFPQSGEQESTEIETNNKTEESETEPLSISVQNLTLDSGKIKIVESLSGTIHEHSLHGLSLIVNNVSNSMTQESPATAIEYETKIGDNGSLTGAGSFKAIAENLDIDITGKIESLNLVDVSHLATRFIGYRIDRGQLNLGYKFVVKGQTLDSKLEALFEKFALAELEDNEQNPLNEDLGLPLPLALNLLRDSDDNIELEIPITGNINSPDFSVSSIVSTVMVKAIKQAVIMNYSPLGMLTMASGIIDLATALQFDPVVFEPRSTEITEAGQKQLGKIIALLQKKPQVKMVICGVATSVDAPEQVAVKVVSESVVAVTNDAAASSDAKTPVVQPMVDPMALIAIAKQRQDTVMDYILSNGSIDKARLISCNIKVAKKKKAKPVVDISI